eukprot:TRINITY_DN9083_c0_g2_i2.p1 TRINITY_DN9083_c0_g2~~TRINITY_DN9083_c0_g2_i2.p1  ORF type:complete len:205 (-),score=6.18 TRINITY_DN9083_c0_g2_i2:174-788(-)
MDGFNSDEAGSEGYSSEETEEVPRPGQDLEARRQRNLENAGMMSQKLLEITVKGPGGGALPWAETLQVTAAEPLLIPDVHDDLQRESAFYRQALSCVPLAWRLCDEAGVKHRRPDDYFAEMLKSDEHMDKVAAVLPPVCAHRFVSWTPPQHGRPAVPPILCAPTWPWRRSSGWPCRVLIPLSACVHTTRWCWLRFWPAGWTNSE